MFDWFGDHRSTSEETIAELTRQFAITLRANFARVARPPAPSNQWAFERVEKILALDPPSWEQCYEVEQLLVDLFDKETLHAELETRRLEARNLPPVVAAHYEKEIEAAADSVRRRALLARLVNDLQWRYTINEGKRRFGKSLARRTGLVSVMMLIAFGALVAVLRWCSSWELRYDDASLFFVAAMSGAWGATFSMLTTMTSRIEASAIYDLKVTRTFVMIASRLLIGSAAASVLFFFLVSGLLGGAAFPTLSKAVANATGTAPVTGGCVQGTPGTCLPMKDFALLIVWSFIAGFSEQLVPSILAKTEQRADAAPERIRPTDGNAPSQAGRQAEETDEGAENAAGANTGDDTRERP